MESKRERRSGCEKVRREKERKKRKKRKREIGGNVYKKNLKRRVGYGERKSMVLWMFWKGMRV